MTTKSKKVRAKRKPAKKVQAAAKVVAAAQPKATKSKQSALQFVHVLAGLLGGVSVLLILACWQLQLQPVYVVQQPAEEVEAADQTTDLLYVQTAATGSLDRIGSSENYTLTLTGAQNLITWFANRPERSAGSQTMQSFVDEWKTFKFDVDAPNAALHIAGADKAQDTFVVELTNPTWKADTKTLTFIVKQVSGATGALDSYVEAADTITDLTFNAATLVIDDASADVVGSCVQVAEQMCLAE